MLNSSLRRVARGYPTATIPRPSTPTNVSISGATFSTRSHQRRHSSSKPPIPPNNGSSQIPATSVKQVGAPRASKRTGTESRPSNRKAARGDKLEQLKPDTKDNEWTLFLPSVPSTQHLNPKDVYVASFFSTHRPITISGPLPPETQMEDFNKVFVASPRQSKRTGATEVIYTLSNLVERLDERIQGHQQDSGVEHKADLIKALTEHNNTVVQQGQANVQHLDGQPMATRNSTIRVMVEEIARRFRPFNTPPAPVPAPEVNFNTEVEALESVDTSIAQADNEAGARADTYEGANELEQGEELLAQQLEEQVLSQDSNPKTSSDFFTAASIHEIREPQSQQRSSLRYIERRRQNLKYYAISVKRQRKHKMKKHKLKKLRRVTRNLRRRLDKI